MYTFGLADFGLTTFSKRSYEFVKFVTISSRSLFVHKYHKDYISTFLQSKIQLHKIRCMSNLLIANFPLPRKTALNKETSC